MIYENTDFGTGQASGRLCQEGHQYCLDQSYEHGAIDFKPMLANMRSTNPDMIFAVSYVMDVAMMKPELDF